jgi:hypothetical protein
MYLTSWTYVNHLILTIKIQYLLSNSIVNATENDPQQNQRKLNTEISKHNMNPPAITN